MNKTLKCDHLCVHICQLLLLSFGHFEEMLQRLLFGNLKTETHRCSRPCVRTIPLLFAFFYFHGIKHFFPNMFKFGFIYTTVVVLVWWRNIWMLPKLYENVWNTFKPQIVLLNSSDFSQIAHLNIFSFFQIFWIPWCFLYAYIYILIHIYTHVKCIYLFEVYNLKT